MRSIIFVETPKGIAAHAFHGEAERVIPMSTDDAENYLSELGDGGVVKVIHSNPVFGVKVTTHLLNEAVR